MSVYYCQKAIWDKTVSVCPFATMIGAKRISKTKIIFSNNHFTKYYIGLKTIEMDKAL